MALKPVYHKSPLTELKALPLTGGRVRSGNALLQTLYGLISADTMPEAALRLAAILEDRPAESAAAAAVRRSMLRQREDGSLPGTPVEQLRVMRGAWVLYEITAERELLQMMMLWAGSVNANVAAWTADGGLRTAPADLLELLLNLYGVTGRKALLTLCE